MASPGRDPATGLLRFVLFGGRTSGKTDASSLLNDAWAADVDPVAGTVAWRPIAAGGSAPEARHSLVGGWFSGGSSAVFATGEGWDAAKKRKAFFSDAHALVFPLAARGSVNVTNGTSTLLSHWSDGSSWVRLDEDGADAPSARYGAAGGVGPGNGTTLLVSHGFSSRRFSDAWALDLAGAEAGRWRRIRSGISSYSATLPHARCLVGSAVASGDMLVMYGGCLSGGGAGGPCPARDVWTLDPTAVSWSRGSSGPTPRALTAMAVHPADDAAVIMYAGDEKHAQGLSVTRASPLEIDAFDPVEGSWTREIAASPRGAVDVRRRSHAMAKAGAGAVVVFGGRNLAGGAHLADVLLITGGADPSAARGSSAGYFSTVMLHAIFMFLGWGVLLQAGHISARYFRRFDPAWFKAHRAVQMAGLALAIAGLVTVASSAFKPHFAFAHGAIGLAVMLVGALQPLNAFIRPHDKTSGARRVWRAIHFSLGRCSLALAVVNMWLGLYLAQAPRWAFGLLLAYTIALAVTYISLEIDRVKRSRAMGPATAVGVEKGGGTGTEMAASAMTTTTTTTTTTTMAGAQQNSSGSESNTRESSSSGNSGSTTTSSPTQRRG